MILDKLPYCIRFSFEKSVINLLSFILDPPLERLNKIFDYFRVHRDSKQSLRFGWLDLYKGKIKFLNFLFILQRWDKNFKRNIT